jgi:two-component system NtrC family sensor kinase
MLKKIGIKLALIVSLTTIIIIGIFSYFSIQSQKDIMFNELHRHADQLSETIKMSTHDAMMANNRGMIQNIINTIGEEACFKQVRLLNKEGAITYSNKPDEIGKMVDKKAESCYKCHAEDRPLQKLPITERTRIYRLHPDSSRVMGIINPVDNEPSCSEADCHVHSSDQTVLGVLDLTVCLEQVDEEVAKSEVKLLIFGFIAIAAIGIIIGIFIRRWVDRPVKELLKATNNVALGNWNYKISTDSKDELGALANSFNNMTQKLTEMKLQLVQSDKLASLGKLAAGVAHEINNPLTGVLTYSSYLLKRSKDNPEFEADLKVIVRETKRSREIVKGLLDFARQSAPKKNKASINDIVDNSITVVNNALNLNKIKLTKIFEDKLPLITVDASQIQQTFTNLIVNAIDAIGNSGGELKIQTSQISLSPHGVKQIKKAACPNGHSLIDAEHKIEGLSSIRVKVKYNANEGYLHMDPIYGRQKHHYGIPLLKNKLVDIYCPDCNISLKVKDKNCPECGSNIYRINIPDEGFIEGCLKYGGTWQKWDYADNAGNINYIEIKFTDNGCGIPEDYLSKIFDPFFSTKGQKGTGLGLSVIWGIIDNHNGLITVQSKVNKGTEFTIRLPLDVNIL